MNEFEIKQLAADIINGKKNISDISSGKILFIIQMIFYKMGYSLLVKQAGTLARERLEKKEWQYCKGIGWMKKESLPHSGLSLVWNNWRITDVEKYLKFIRA